MDNSPFARLSPELRNKIYQLALRKSTKWSIDIDLTQLARSNQLTRTCRQVHSETHAMFYAINEFFVCIYNKRDADQLETLLDHLGPETVSCIRCLEINAYNGGGTRDLVVRSRLLAWTGYRLDSGVVETMPDVGEKAEEELTLMECIYGAYKMLGIGVLVEEETFRRTGSGYDWGPTKLLRTPPSTAS